MNDCKLVLDLLEEALTPAEKEIVNKYVDQYGKAVGIAVLIADLLRGRSRFGRQRTDAFSTLFDELISAALDMIRPVPPQSGVKPSDAEFSHDGKRLNVPIQVGHMTQLGEGAANQQIRSNYELSNVKTVRSVRKESGEEPFVTIIDPKDYGEGREQ